MQPPWELTRRCECNLKHQRINTPFKLLYFYSYLHWLNCTENTSLFKGISMLHWSIEANYKVSKLILITPCLGSSWGAAGSLTAYPLGQWRAGMGAAFPGKSCSQVPLLDRRGCFVRRSRRKWHRQPRHQPCCSQWRRRTLELRRPPFGRRSNVSDDNAWICQQLR